MHLVIPHPRYCITFTRKQIKLIVAKQSVLQHGNARFVKANCQMLTNLLYSIKTQLLLKIL